MPGQPEEKAGMQAGLLPAANPSPRPGAFLPSPCSAPAWCPALGRWAGEAGDSGDWGPPCPVGAQSLLRSQTGSQR